MAADGVWGAGTAADAAAWETFALPTAAHTAALGAALAGCLGPGATLALDGPLGAGKTTLVRALVAGLGSAAAVASPTYSLVHRYEGRIPVLHVDAFRLDSSAGWAALGLDDELERAILCVEWSERIEPVLATLPADALWRVVLAHVAGGGRCARLRQPGWKRLRADAVTRMLR